VLGAGDNRIYLPELKALCSSAQPFTLSIAQIPFPLQINSDRADTEPLQGISRGAGGDGASFPVLDPPSQERSIWMVRCSSIRWSTRLGGLSTVASLSDRWAALAKRLGLAGPAGQANTNGTVAAAE
jgi:hypothetical protein